jgi:DNA-binding NarL/FixJ family response regulator
LPGPRCRCPEQHLGIRVAALNSVKRDDVGVGVRVRNTATLARILLADDHELIRKGLRAIIETNKDWQICAEATNGQEAVERAIELQPDLIILDVTMPVLNGMQAARLIHKLAPQTKILILSMHDSPQLANEAIRVGADVYLIKTEPQSKLLDAVAVLLNR